MVKLLPRASDPAALFNADGEPYGTVWQMRRIRAFNLCDARKFSERIHAEYHNDYRHIGSSLT
jgi:hypothetical protein